MEGALGWFPDSFNDSSVFQVPVYDGVSPGGPDTEAEVRVSYWN